jgi:hypothetical protein
VVAQSNRTSTQTTLPNIAILVCSGVLATVAPSLWRQKRFGWHLLGSDTFFGGLFLGFESLLAGSLHQSDKVSGFRENGLKSRPARPESATNKLILMGVCAVLKARNVRRTC